MSKPVKDITVKNIAQYEGEPKCSTSNAENHLYVWLSILSHFDNLKKIISHIQMFKFWKEIETNNENLILF